MSISSSTELDGSSSVIFLYLDVVDMVDGVELDTCFVEVEGVEVCLFRILFFCLSLDLLANQSKRLIAKS